MEPEWMKRFITITESGKFIAWDETQARQIGVFSNRKEAVEAIIAYAETLDYEGD